MVNGIGSPASNRCATLVGGPDLCRRQLDSIRALLTAESRADHAGAARADELLRRRQDGAS